MSSLNDTRLQISQAHNTLSDLEDTLDSLELRLDQLKSKMISHQLVAVASQSLVKSHHTTTIDGMMSDTAIGQYDKRYSNESKENKQVTRDYQSGANVNQLSTNATNGTMVDWEFMRVREKIRDLRLQALAKLTLLQSDNLHSDTQCYCLCNQLKDC